MIRKATEKDSKQLAVLMGELGYHPKEMEQRFSKINANDFYTLR
ncbi:hypothetical protein [Virgibacillus alimentarius]|uniref:Acetyltransferase n=1 Tax=Virgibacillus alimentarius TaxID=698769 RepID=A0ABS4SA92_9BACI|nr:hypothetical protein [Virgibacillus alimentarius]MBP2258426.1 hypothetical protein [Virgibacillus alimentarius]